MYSAEGTEAARTGCLRAGFVLPLRLESDVKSMETKLLSLQLYTELVITYALTIGSYIHHWKVYLNFDLAPNKSL